jgi:hypothetical protein
LNLMTENRFCKFYLEDFERETETMVSQKIHFDGYEGWIQTISSYIRIKFQLAFWRTNTLNSDLVEYVTGPSNLLIPIPLGASFQ